ncbi:MAG: hypothetical protein ACLQOO_02090 [Terriglobia bacterium]
MGFSVYLISSALPCVGLRRAGKVVVRLANEERVEREKASGIHLAIGDREMSASCLIRPPGCEPLVGQLVMEELDLIPDPILRTLTPRAGVTIPSYS